MTGVKVKNKTIECEYVVLATGMWSRQIGEDMGFSIPLYPAEHFYVITEAIKELPKNIPVLRDFNDSLYLKEDAGKMLIGIFEENQFQHLIKQTESLKIFLMENFQKILNILNHI